MAFQTVFQRYELKYLLTPEQKKILLDKIAPYMTPDPYGKTTIRNLYYDTEDYLLIRRSIEKPVYKEKLRIRSYKRADFEDKVFVELKKKYKSVVFKRRISVKNKKAMDWLAGSIPSPKNTQIAREIDYFLSLYPTLHPSVFLSYDREAFYGKDSDDFRVTFDENILARQEDLFLSSNVCGTPILPDKKVLMEIKCGGGIPLWMVKVLSEERIYKTSFSKYGTAYKNLIFPEIYNKNSLNFSEVNKNAWHPFQRTL